MIFGALSNAYAFKSKKEYIAITICRMRQWTYIKWRLRAITLQWAI